jgi:plasmid stabilization system protein ParE
MKIKILESAVEDLKRGYSFYEKISEGLGNYFLDSLFSDIDSLLLYAGIHSIHFGKYRLLSKRFPFAAYYEIEDDSIIVYAVLDCRQDPKKIEEKLLKDKKEK